MAFYRYHIVSLLIQYIFLLPLILPLHPQIPILFPITLAIRAHTLCRHLAIVSESIIITGSFLNINGCDLRFLTRHLDHIRMLLVLYLTARGTGRALSE